MSEFALEMQDISKSFPGVQALKSANLSIRTGEIHGLVGENGAGKSTIIKVLAGVYQNESGEIRVQGKTLNSIGSNSARALGSANEKWFGVPKKRYPRFLAFS